MVDGEMMVDEMVDDGWWDRDIFIIISQLTISWSTISSTYHLIHHLNLPSQLTISFFRQETREMVEQLEIEVVREEDEMNENEESYHKVRGEIWLMRWDGWFLSHIIHNLIMSQSTISSHILPSHNLPCHLQ